VKRLNQSANFNRKLISRNTTHRFYLNKVAVGLTMRSVAWNRFPTKNLQIDSNSSPCVESSYLYTDMCKFESSQKDESRAQSADSSKAYTQRRAFNG